jgi:hypothetical protein
MNCCTFFDRSYLNFGLNLYESLKKNCSNFKLFIVAFDDYTLNFLKTKKLKNVYLINYKKILTQRLVEIKKERKKNEFFWTCTPFVINYILKKFKLNNITYLDADIFFYNNPNKILEKYKNYSVLMTKHNFHFDDKYLEKLTGKYCVQFLTFKNNKDGLSALDWWKKKCEEWCYDKFENGKFGDQKYLEEFPKKFKNVKVIENDGVGIAPWNIKNYKVTNNKIYKKKKNIKIDIIFYHFHYLRQITKNIFFIGSWPIDNNIKNLIYFPYINKIIQNNKIIKKQKENLFRLYIKYVFEILRYFKYKKNYLKIDNV